MSGSQYYCECDFKKASLDIFSEVGMNFALLQVFPKISPVPDEIAITFVRVGLENPLVNVIRISGVRADEIAISGGSYIAFLTSNLVESITTLATISAAPSFGVEYGVATTVIGRIDANPFVMSTGGDAIAALGYASRIQSTLLRQTKVPQKC